jgi:AraC-like DNA-binding protein
LEIAYSKILDDYKTDISLNQLALETCMSKYNLIKSFKQVYKKTPKQLQIERRIQKGRELLKVRSDMSVTEIATTLGYADLASFSNQFKKMTGVPPSSVKQC